MTTRAGLPEVVDSLPTAMPVAVLPLLTRVASAWRWRRKLAAREPVGDVTVALALALALAMTDRLEVGVAKAGEAVPDDGSTGSTGTPAARWPRF